MPASQIAIAEKEKVTACPCVDHGHGHADRTTLGMDCAKDTVEGKCQKRRRTMKAALTGIMLLLTVLAFTGCVSPPSEDAEERSWNEPSRGWITDPDERE